MQILDDFKDTVSTIISENKKGTVIIGGLLLFLCLSALILFLGQTFSFSSKPKAAAPKTPEAPLVLSQPLMIPEGPVLPQGYVESRIPRQNWRQDAVTEWFTVPDQKTIDDLEKANDTFITDIVGSAP